MGNKRKILLLVDKDIHYATSAMRYLKQIGFNVLHAQSYQDALPFLCNSQSIDMLLWDLKSLLISEDINQMRTALKETHIPIVLLTSEVEIEESVIDEFQIYAIAMKASGFSSLSSAIKLGFKLYGPDKLLSKSEQSYKGLMKDASESIYVINRDGVILDINERVTEMYGYSRDEIIGRTSEFLAAPGKNDFKEIQEYRDKAFLSGIPQHFEFWSKDKSGKIFPKEVICSKGKYFNKDVIFAIARDISDRKHTAEELRKRIEHLQLLQKLTNSLQGILDWKAMVEKIYEIIPAYLSVDRANIFLYNEEAGGLISDQLIGVPRKDLVSAIQSLSVGISGKCFLESRPICVDDCSHSDIIPEKFIRQLNLKSVAAIPIKAEGRMLGVLRLDYMQKTHSFSKAEIDLFHLLGEQIGILLRNAQLFTEQAEMDRALKQSEEKYRLLASELKELNDSKDKFISILSHDLRNPFQGFLGLTDMLAQEWSKLPPAEVEMFLSELNKSLHAQYNLLEELLQWSRLQTGKIRFEPVKIRVRDEIEKVLKPLQLNILKKKISLSIQIGDDCCVNADENLFSILIRNLISNAIKFSYENGTVAIKAEVISGGLHVSVEDNGAGISEANLKKLFRYDVIHTSLGTNSEKGTGLGLILCKEIVEKHQGKIWAESRLNQGSKFTLTLPI